MTSDTVTISGFDTTTTGTKTITVTYKENKEDEGLTTKFNIEVVEGTEFNYTENGDGTLTITGYTGTDTNVYIPKSIDGKDVTGIGKNCFDTNMTIKNVVFPTTLRLIEKEAFAYCMNLTEITIQESVTSIEESAFDGCDNLTNTTILSRNVEIGTNAIPGNNENNTINCYKGSTPVEYAKTNNINYYLIDGTKAIEVTTLPTKTTYVKGYEYEKLNLVGGKITVTKNNEETEELDLTDENIKITGYDSSTVGTNTLTVTYDGATTTLDITITGSDTEFTYTENEDGTLTITGYTGTDTYVYIPKAIDGKAVSIVGAQAFRAKTTITNVEIPRTVTKIEEKAFQVCSSLTEIEIPSSVTEIGDNAFNRCTGLTKIKIPYNNTVIGENTIPSNTTIYCYKDSNAYNYAVNNSIEYILLSEEHITAEVIKNNPEKYFGKQVYYSANGIEKNDSAMDSSLTGWKVFYSDGENIFLTTSDYLPAEKVPTEETGMTTTGKNKAYWESVPSNQTVTNLNESFMFERWSDYSTYNNGKCVSTLLNTENWTSFVNTSYADYAIGSPTLEMFVASWNTLYPSQVISCNNTSSYGYYYGSASHPEGSSLVDLEVYSYIESGYELYFSRAYNHTGSGGYWLASPSAYGYDGLVCVSNGVDVSSTGYGSKNLSVRPLVRLKSGIGLDDIGFEDDDTELTEITVKTNPTKQVYQLNEELDLTDAQITLTYSDESTQDISLLTEGQVTEGIEVTGYDKTTVGEKEITVTYTQEEITKETSFKVYVTKDKIEYQEMESGITITKIEVTDGSKRAEIPEKLVQKTVIGIGNNVVTNLNDIEIISIPNTVTTISETAFQNEDGTTNEELTIECKSDNDATINYAKEKEIYYEFIDKEISGISIEKMITKTKYELEEELDLTGGKILITYEGSTEEEPITSTISIKKPGVEVTKESRKGDITTFKVEYKGASTTFTVQFGVMGDVNNDGVVDITDVMVLKRHVVATMLGETDTDWIIPENIRHLGNLDDTNEELDITDVYQLKVKVLENM